MSFREIQFDCFNKIIVPALDLFYSEPRDQDLIVRNASERAIVANIYFKANAYLAQQQHTNQGIDDLVIDIEYNRNAKGSKKVFEKCGFCDIQDCFINQRHLQYTTSSPDMIIHHRGFNDNNQVVIEFKKVSNRNNKERDDDKAKLIYFTCQQPFPDHENENYQYHIGFFIDLDLATYSVTTYHDANCDAPRIRQGGVWL
jgi:hypothetical protein